MEKQKETPVDLVAQENELTPANYPDIPEEFKKHYTQIVLNNLGLRIEVEKDFRWVRQKLKLMREVSHTKQISILNEVLEYLDKAIPEMKKIRIAFKKQIDNVRESHNESKPLD